MSLEHAQQYLAKVLAWPQEGDLQPSYVNVHWSLTKLDRHGKPIWTGRACRSVREATNTVSWALRGADTKDIYVCMSAQAEALPKVSGKGNNYLAPIRSQENAVALKSLFIDVDAKGADKNSYSNLTEAAAALAQFIKGVGLPPPSAIVNSGGGLHVYWTFDRALTRDEWQPLAFALAEATKRHGLKCDSQCTIDAARVLRVPGTFNRKLDAARPVSLAGGRTGDDYSVERLRRALAPYEVAVPAAQSLLPRRPPLQGESELSMGIDRSAAAPVDLDSILPQCAFLNEAVTTGGKDYANPLWNLTTLIATFTRAGLADAHRMAYGHPGYTKESTEELYLRKERERAQKGLGWPSCRTISATGASQCGSCVHFAVGKSPLNLAARPAPSVAPSTSNTPSALGAVLPAVVSGGSDLPPGFKRLGNGVVCRILIAADGSATEEPISSYPMTDPWLQPEPVYTLNFSTVTEVGRKTQIAVPLKESATKDGLRKCLWTQGMPLREHESKVAMEFIVSWIEHLQKQKEAVISSAPFGWATLPKGTIEGFIFGGSKFTPLGTSGASNPDPIIARQYRPIGEREAWIKAAELITSQGRPALDTIIASAFAAPLVKFTNEPGVLLSTYSQESGIGKTTSLKIAQAVWGDPVRAMQGLSDTENSVNKKLGELRALPVYWDEIKTEEDAKRFVKLVFSLTSRKEKARLQQSSSFRESGTWQTMLISASNDSIMAHVMAQTKQTLAGVYRVFEYEVQPWSGRGKIDQADASKIVGKLDNNYGQIGLEYAQFLGRNHALVEQKVEDFYKQVGIEMKMDAEERYWRVMVATLLMGATFANSLGFTKFDVSALKQFLFGVVQTMRGTRHKTPVDMKNSLNVSNVLAQFLNQMRARHTLRTNIIHRRPGKPPTGSINTANTDLTKLDAIYVHVGIEDKVLRLSATKFAQWLEDEGYSRFMFQRSLETEFGARLINARMGAGTNYATPQEYLIEIDLTKTNYANFLDEA